MKKSLGERKLHTVLCEKLETQENIPIGKTSTVKKAMKVNKAFNVRRGLLKLQKVVQCNPVLNWGETKHESELAQTINQCKKDQTRSQLKQRRDVKAFQKELNIVREKISAQKKEKDMIKKMKKQTKVELKNLSKS